jgi:hypothetical protein
LLLAAKSFNEPFSLWAGTAKVGEIVNGGFEEPLLLNNSALGWIVSRTQPKTKLAVDVSERFAGERSLQIALDGEWDVGEPLLSQTIAVTVAQRYRLSFAVKTKELVTGGPPRIVLFDAKSNQILGKSDAFPATTNSWQQMNVELTTPPAAEAVVIRLTRDSCASSPCPIFGVVWLDNFSLQRL